MKRGSCWDSTVQNSLVEAVSWFFSSHQLSAIHLLPPPQPPWGGEENHRKLKTLGWDKNSIEIEIKKNVIIIIRKMRFNKKESGELNPVKASDAQYNCPAHPWAAVDPCQTTLPSLYTGHDILWYEISLWLVWVNCPGCAPSQILLKLLTDNVWKTAKSLTEDQPLDWGWALLSSTHTIRVLLTLLSSWIQNTALYQQQGKKPAASWLKPGQSVIENCGIRYGETQC